MVNVPTTILTAIGDSRLFLHRKAFIAAAISPRADLAPGVQWIGSQMFPGYQQFKQHKFGGVLLVEHPYVTYVLLECPIFCWSAPSMDSLIIRGHCHFKIPGASPPSVLRYSPPCALLEVDCGSKCGHKIGQFCCQAA